MQKKSTSLITGSKKYLENVMDWTLPRVDLQLKTSSQLRTWAYIHVSWCSEWRTSPIAGHEHTCIYFLMQHSLYNRSDLTQNIILASSLIQIQEILKQAASSCLDHSLQKAQTAFQTFSNLLITKIPKLTAIFKNWFHSSTLKSIKSWNPVSKHRNEMEELLYKHWEKIRSCHISRYSAYVQSETRLCKLWHIFLLCLKKYLHYLLKLLLFKKICNFPPIFKIKCHTLSSVTSAHLVFKS